MRTAILSLIVSALSVGGLIQPANAEIAWESSLRKAHTRATKENKLILLHFIRDNCAYCDKLESGAFKTREVNEVIGQSFVPLKINVSDSKGNKKLAEMFKVDRFPMDVVVTTDGQARAHGVSPQESARYVSMLTKTLPSSANPMLPGPAAPQRQIASAPPQSQRPAPATSHAVPGYAAAQQQQQQQPPVGPVATSNAVASTHQSPTYSAPNNQAQNKLVSARTNQTDSGMTLSMPEKVTDSVPAIAAPPSDVAVSAADEPKLAMDGFCAVSVVKESRWVEGKPRFGVVHLGKLYLFVSEQAMQTFLADPIPYTPVLNEIDVVRFFEERKIVPGKREWAMQDPINKRMFFFSDEAAMMHFENEYARYVDAAIEVMNKAVNESNPGS